MPTLSEIPGFPLELTEDARTLSSPASEGAIGHGPITDQWPRIWRMRISSAPDSVRVTLDALHDSVAGGAISMDWTPPGAGAAVKVRFLPGQEGYRKRLVEGNNWEIQLGVEEALGI